VLFSDYGKGGLTHIPRMIELARARPASRCWSTRRAATTAAMRAPPVITPNRAELAQVIGAWSQRGAAA
jgi:bifunctional ADP-heptose synthase (sugar kinase/adenylyltransferase)